MSSPALTLTLPPETLDVLARRVVEQLNAAGCDARSPWLTAKEAAEYLRFPTKRIYNLSARGEIPHRKQEARLLFRRDELDAWLDGYYAGPEVAR